MAGSNWRRHVPGWEPIIHRDLKTENIYLAEQDEGSDFQSYPALKVGDFGISLVLKENDEMNPLAYNGNAGTEYWMPPEMVPFVDKNDSLPPAKDATPKLWDYTNVWGIGALLIRLMNRERRRDLTGPSYLKGPEEPRLNRLAEETYTATLCGLLEQCVRYEPLERIGLRELKDQIRQSTGAGPAGAVDHAQGLRGAPIGAANRHLALECQEDEYRRGFALPE